jgi:hypothetical protein
VESNREREPGSSRAAATGPSIDIPAIFHFSVMHFPTPPIRVPWAASEAAGRPKGNPQGEDWPQDSQRLLAGRTSDLQVEGAIRIGPRAAIRCAQFFARIAPKTRKSRKRGTVGPVARTHTVKAFREECHLGIHQYPQQRRRSQRSEPAQHQQSQSLQDSAPPRVRHSRAEHRREPEALERSYVQEEAAS